jgi:hypothetical protein
MTTRAAMVMAIQIEVKVTKKKKKKKKKKMRKRMKTTRKTGQLMQQRTNATTSGRQAHRERGVVTRETTEMLRRKTMMNAMRWSM